MAGGALIYRRWSIKRPTMKQVTELQRRLLKMFNIEGVHQENVQLILHHFVTFAAFAYFWKKNCAVLYKLANFNTLKKDAKG